ncbi:substrate-binding periplasmic protein [Pseudoduganella namucuonensis]|uniref:Amino acid ABC transporter substrate-binding protein, PAAT family n=1 Tax=Pseudoduganella namucuonensis TaxID=1035707 RepID=A0A1I7ITB9_9BURK|nr:transporter substrate-binding domain-containing protein [Pseudoduganella namucuonensis]SFU76128.1 amino acid ABC transporter substrate-binding protein, PAAT family [Pseudoduganella namucuonensis]
MHRFFRLAGWAALCLGSAACAADPVTIVSSENAPFAYTDARTGKVAGVTTDILAAVFKRANIAYAAEIYPWARAYMMGKSNADTCVFPVTRLPEREALFQWVGPLSVNTWVLFARADFSSRLEGLEDLRSQHIGGLLEDGPSQYLKAQGLNVELVGDNKHNIRKLAAGRLTLWATGLERGRILAEEMGVTGLKPVFLLREVDHYMACHPGMPPATMAKLNKALESLRGEGALKAIAAQHESKRLLGKSTQPPGGGERARR